jgi:hypothetical protein
MSDQCTLHLVLRLRGGGPGQESEEEQRRSQLWPAPDGAEPTTTNSQPNSFSSMAAEAQARKVSGPTPTRRSVALIAL